MFTREEYENLINNSPLFEIDKESSPALFATEERKLINLIVDYYRHCIYPNKDMSDYDLPLMKTARSCIKGYNREIGVFLNYFNRSFATAYRSEKGIESIEEKRQGVQLSEKDDKQIRELFSFVNNNLKIELDTFIKDEYLQEYVARQLGVSIDKVKQLIEINNSSTAILHIVKSDKDSAEELDLFDKVKGLSQSIENEYINKISVVEIIESIDKAYDSVQERQKVALSMLLTVEIIEDLDYDLTYIEEVLKGISFRSQRVMNYFIKYRKTPTARQIAARLGVSENSLSRTYKNFKLKIRINNE